MNQLIERKRRGIYLVEEGQHQLEAGTDYNPSADSSFRGWLRAGPAPEAGFQILPSSEVNLAVLNNPLSTIDALELFSAPTFSREPKEQYPEPKTLTTQDFIQVMLATTRESYTHQQWPAGAFAKFLAADVIAPGKKSQ